MRKYLGRLFFAIVSIGGFAASVWLGMQIEQRLTASELEQTKQAAFQKGLNQAKSQYEATEGPMIAFSKELAKIFSSDEARSKLPKEFVEPLNLSLKSASSGDFGEASKKLPPIVSLVGTPSCIPLGQIVEMQVGESLDQCETGTVIVMTDRYYVGPDPFADLAINGEEKRLYLGRRLQIRENCHVALLRLTNAKKERVAVLRFGCA